MRAGKKCGSPFRTPIRPPLPGFRSDASILLSHYSIWARTRTHTHTRTHMRTHTFSPISWLLFLPFSRSSPLPSSLSGLSSATTRASTTCVLTGAGGTLRGRFTALAVTMPNRSPRSRRSESAWSRCTANSRCVYSLCIKVFLCVRVCVGVCVCCVRVRVCCGPVPPLSGILCRTAHPGAGGQNQHDPGPQRD